MFCPFPSTYPLWGWRKYDNVSCWINDATGKHDLWMKFEGGDDDLFNLDWWTFKQEVKEGNQYAPMFVFVGLYCYGNRSRIRWI